MPTEHLLKIDGNEFDVMLIKLSRSASILDKQANRTLDGDLHREIIGTYINYSLEFAYNDEPYRYNLLWNILIEPKAFHSITLPANTGVSTFNGYISNVKDEITYANPYNSEQRRFKGLSCDIVAKTPNLRPRR